MELTERGFLAVDYGMSPTLTGSERGMTILEHPRHGNRVELPFGLLRVIPALLRPGEEVVGGEELLKRLRRSRKISLDLGHRSALLASPELIPEDWKSCGAVYFPGTILGKRNEHNRVLTGTALSRHVPGMVWMGVSWRPTEKDLSGFFSGRHFVAVLGST